MSLPQSRDFATVPSRFAGHESRAARKIAQRKGRPSEIVNAESDVPEDPIQSDSREVTEANEGKPSDVQVMPHIYCSGMDKPAVHFVM